MTSDIEVERVAARPVQQTADTNTDTDTGPHYTTDSRLVSNTDDVNQYGYGYRNAVAGETGWQFILASWGTLVAGLYTIMAPFALGFAHHVPRARSNDMIIGMVIATLGATRVFGNYRSGRLNQILSGLSALAGLWMIFAPFVLQYQDMHRPMTSDIIVGVATIALSVWSYITSRDADEDAYDEAYDDAR